MFCSLFDEMENNNNYYQQAGDLIDVVIRAGNSSEFSLGPSSDDRRPWPHLPADDSSMGFVDPFGSARDPPFPQYPYFSAFNCATAGGGGGFAAEAAAADRPCNIFSRMLQISPSLNVGDGVISTDPPCESTTIVGNSPSTTKASPRGGGTFSTRAPNLLWSKENSRLQISPTRNPPNKRRKSQARKVVCIPAPAPANIRSSSGEVVPSDLWAWRKYGQKPIKGSPYPRGYYRCSSSKGCSARKQVERSRTDPNMLVITYTSEHNHPWPTQRNALAGSTRSHPSRTFTAASDQTSPKHERNTVVKDEKIDNDQTIEKAAAATTTAEGDHHQEFPNYDLIFSDFADQMNDDRDHHHHHHDHLADPMMNNNLQFSSHGFSTGNDHEGSKDPFLELYDWAENSNGSFFKEAK